MLQLRARVEQGSDARPLGDRPLHGSGGGLGQVHVANAEPLLKPAEGLERDAVEVLRPAELQPQVLDPLAGEVVRGRDQVVGGRQGGNLRVAIDEGPVLQVVVAVGDQHRERQPPNELEQRFGVAAAVDQACDRLEVPLVLVLRIDVPDLGQVLDVNQAPMLVPVEPPNGVGELLVSGPHAVGQAIVDPLSGHQHDVGRVDADRAGQRHHRELIARDITEPQVGRLDDPVAALAGGRDGQPLVPQQHGELHRHPGQGEPDAGVVVVVRSGDVRVRHVTPHGFDRELAFGQHADRARQVVADLGEQLDLPLPVHAALAGDPVPEHPLREQVGEPRRDPDGGDVDLVRPVLEDQPEHGAIRVFAIVEVELEPCPVANPIDDPGAPVADPDAEAIGVRLTHHRSAPPPRHRPGLAGQATGYPRTPTRSAAG